MAAQDRVKINISVDVDDAKLDVLLAKLTALDSAAQSLERRFGKMATASRQMNENLRNTNKTLRYTNNEVKKVTDRFDKAANKIDATNKKLNDSNNALQQHAKATQQVNKQMDNHDKRNKRMRQSLGKFDMVLKRVVMQLGKFIMTLGKLSFIAVAGQLALFTAGLLTVKLALITGRAAIQIYQIALKGLSVTAAGVATALSVAAAAMREYNEAMLAPSMGGGQQGFQRASRLSRAAGSQNAGLLGGESTTAVVAALAKAGVSTGRVSPIARQLINLTGGDPAAVAAVAKTLGGGDFRAASSAVKGAAGFRADSLNGITTMPQLLNAIQSGSVVSGAYANQSDLLAGTFIGTAKTQFSGLKDLFADMGQPLLGPFRDTMLEISQILRSNFIALGAVINRFGAESFAPTLTTMVEKTMDFVRMNIFDHLEDIEQMGENFVGFFRSVRNFFGDMANFLGEFEPAANVVIDMFGAMRGTGGGRSLFRQFSDLVVKNAAGFKNFGASIGRVLGALFDALGSGQSGFFAKLPLFSDILDTIASDLIPGLAATMEGLMPILQALPDLLSQIGQLFEYTIAPTFKTLATLLGFVLGMPGGGILGLAGFAMMKGGKRTRGSMMGMMGLGMGGDSKKSGFFSQRMAKINERRALKGRDPLNSGHALRGLVGLSLGFGGANQAYQEGTMAGGGTLSAAAGGAMIGSIAGPLGTAIGAAVGAGIGMISGVLGRRAQEAQRKNNVKALADRFASLDFSTMRSAELFAMRDQLSTSASLIRKNELLDPTFGLFSSQRAAQLAGDQFDDLEGAALEALRFSPLRDVLANSPSGLSLNNFSMNDLAVTRTQYLAGSSAFKRQTLDMITALADMEGMTVSAFSNKYIGRELDMDSTPMDFQLALTRLQEPMDEVRKAFEEAEETIKKFTINSAKLAEEFGVSTEKIIEVADGLGYTLQNDLTMFQRQVLRAYALPEMDRTKTFLSDFSATPIGIAEKNATSRAAFTTFRDALISDTVTSDMYRDAVESFATYAVLQGVSPDLGGLAGISELYEQFGILPKSGTGYFDEIHENLMPATEQILRDLSAQHSIPYETLRNTLFPFGTERGFSNSSVQELERRIDREQRARQAITGGPVFNTAQDRLTALRGTLSGADYDAFTAEFHQLAGGLEGIAGMSDAELNTLITQAVVDASLATAQESREVDNHEALQMIATAIGDPTGIRIQGSSLKQMAVILDEVIERD